MTDRRFHKMEFRVTLMGENSINPESSLEQLHDETLDGVVTAKVERTSDEEVDGKTAAEFITQNHGDPGDIELTDEGEELFEDERDDEADNGGIAEDEDFDE